MRCFRDPLARWRRPHREAVFPVRQQWSVMILCAPKTQANRLNAGMGEILSGADATAVTPAQRSLAVGCAMIGVVGSAAAYLIIRKIGKRANALHSISYFSLYSVSLPPATLHLSLGTADPPGAGDRIMYLPPLRPIASCHDLGLPVPPTTFADRSARVSGASERAPSNSPEQTYIALNSRRC